MPILAARGGKANSERAMPGFFAANLWEKVIFWVLGRLMTRSGAKRVELALIPPSLSLKLIAVGL